MLDEVLDDEEAPEFSAGAPQATSVNTAKDVRIVFGLNGIFRMPLSRRLRVWMHKE